jgi:hypothetical protein
MSTIRKSVNLNTILAVLGALALFGPDLASVAATMNGLGIPWLTTVAKVLGALALLLSSLPRIIGRLRPLLALLGLATPPEVVEAQSDDAVTVPETPAAKAQEIVDQATRLPCWVVWALIGAGALLFSPNAAEATECHTVSTLVYQCDRLTLQPGFAAGMQVNLRYLIDEGLTEGAYQRFSGMAGYGASYHGERVTMGAGLYFGVGLSKRQPNCPQVNLLLTLFDRYAFGVGVQRVPFAGGHVYQWLLTVAGNYSAGATTTTFLDALKDFAKVCVGAACGI